MTAIPDNVTRGDTFKLILMLFTIKGTYSKRLHQETGVHLLKWTSALKLQTFLNYTGL